MWILSLFKCSKRSKLMCRGRRPCSVLAFFEKFKWPHRVCVFVRGSSFMPQVVLDIFALRLINYRLEKNKLTAGDTSVRSRLRIQIWRILLTWRCARHSVKSCIVWIASVWFKYKKLSFFFLDINVDLIWIGHPLCIPMTKVFDKLQSNAYTRQPLGYQFDVGGLTLAFIHAVSDKDLWITGTLCNCNYCAAYL